MTPRSLVVLLFGALIAFVAVALADTLLGSSRPTGASDLLACGIVGALIGAAVLAWDVARKSRTATTNTEDPR